MPCVNKLKTSLPQDVCIFCATRILITSAKPAQRTQRRLFGSTRGLRKPTAGGAAGLKRQDTDDDGWAAYSPPAKADQQRSTEAGTGRFRKNSIGGRQAEGEGARDSLQNGFQAGSQKGFGDLRQGASGIQDRQSYSSKSSSEQRGVNVRFTNRRTTNLDFGNTENTWQGLRRRTPPADSSDDRGKARVLEGTRRENTHRNEEQQRRLEASRQGDFVELGGLNRRNRWSSPDERHQASDLVRRLEGRAGFPRGREDGDSARDSNDATAAFRVQFGRYGVVRFFR